ncbi:MAG: SAM-dependent methyltransferase [Chitinophagaceae bacterium]
MEPQKKATVYLIPTVLSSDEKALDVLPAYIRGTIKKCSVFFTEQERTTRRFFKKLWKDMVIDDYAWYAIHHIDENIKIAFRKHILNGEIIGIISEAGCPGIADPGQDLVAIAHLYDAQVIPLVGPSSILLALMASGLNGQNFHFCGYLPIDPAARRKRIKELEDNSHAEKCTKIFIETPYRNNALLAEIFTSCQPETFLCIGYDITGDHESIQTKKIKDWKKVPPVLAKIPAIFLLLAE